MLIYSLTVFSKDSISSIEETDSKLFINSINLLKIIFKKTWVFSIPISFKEISNNSQFFLIISNKDSGYKSSTNKLFASSFDKWFKI